MVQVIVALFFLFWTASVLGFGSIVVLVFNRFACGYRRQFEDEFVLPLAGFFGIALISSLVTVANFFIPIRPGISLALLCGGVVLFWINIKVILPGAWRRSAGIIIAPLVYCLLFSLTDVKAYDTCLYHWQRIKWIMEYPLPFGLANLHSRFGYHSSWFEATAVVQPCSSLTGGPFFIINAIAMFLFGVLVMANLRKLKEGSFQPSTFFFALCLIPWYFMLNDQVASPAPDLPAMLILLIISGLIIRSVDEPRRSGDCLFAAGILALFALTIKLSTAVYAVILLPALLHHWLLRRGASTGTAEGVPPAGPLVLFGISAAWMVIPWSVTDFFLTGCLAFPAKVGYFPNLKWAITPERLDDLTRWIRSWARSPGQNPDQVLNGWGWLIPWLKAFLYQESILIGLLIVGISLLLIQSRQKARVVELRGYLFPLTCFVSGITYWFLTAPDPRFGPGYLYALALLIVSVGMANLFSIHRLRLNELWASRRMRVAVWCLVAGVLMLGFGLFIFSGKAYFIFQSVKDIARSLTHVGDNQPVRLYKITKFGYLMVGMGAFFCLAGILLWKRFQQYYLASRIGLALLTVFFSALLLSGNWYFRLAEIANTRKIPPIFLEPHRTREGVVIYTSLSGLFGDAPLLSTPQFDPDLHISFSGNGTPEMFWFSR